MTLSVCKYKDELPLKTITKIRNILADLNILVVETGWKNSADGFYSVTVTIRNTDLATNGKGTTYEYALASAYAELMERLQNQAFFRLNCDLKEDALGYQGFYYAPDEKPISMEEFLNSNEEWSSIQINKMPKDFDVQELLKKWQQVSYEKVPTDFMAYRALLGAVALSMGMVAAIIYLPALQGTFGTMGLSLSDWLVVVGASAGTAFVDVGARKILQKFLPPEEDDTSSCKVVEPLSAT
ncbi:hypothetical protein HA075_25215 [bacterium BFN5]|nr:hypothetical protein HA075_25215 [bacterium BFN5]